MSCCPCSLLVGAVVLFVFYKMFCGGKKKPKIHEKDYKKDRVYLYQFPRNSTLPNMSPYCLKIEAFLRLHKIDYENRYTLSQRSQHGLLPFVELNGEQIADSEIIEERLIRHFNLPTTGSEYENSVARAIARLVSHHTTPILTKYKVLDETDDTVDDFIEVAGVPGYLHFLKPLAAWLFRRIATKKIKAILGLFSDSEFDMLLRKDLGALKGILGEKKFFLGDKISNVDASIFGHIASAYYLPRKTIAARILDQDYPTLVRWAEDVKNELFPDDFTR